MIFLFKASEEHQLDLSHLLRWGAEAISLSALLGLGQHPGDEGDMSLKAALTTTRILKTTTGII